MTNIAVQAEEVRRKLSVPVFILSRKRKLRRLRIILGTVRSGWLSWTRHRPRRSGSVLAPTENSFIPPLRGWESQDSMTRLNAVSASEHIQALYRLLLIRTGQRSQAEHALRETLTESVQNTRRNQSKNKPDFVEFYRTALKIPAIASGPSEKDLAGWPLALHHLPEPGRSAITLFYLEIFSPRVLSEILDLDIDELARIIGTARKYLESQQTKSSIP
jgi:hypothetical protein